ncbi:MBL fold metallo-hydrolase [Desulfurobacterium thermolithotrophum]|uniref:MBL fold metallo-hydrolase n=1 Tax=Desulfurobacterium thermolithotrophum TaxID=64160 RepID=UPI0013D110D0|nr:MBL fold metallo-hydrolase [Desulfurobacterium thermolithotrophum]
MKKDKEKLLIRNLGHSTFLVKKGNLTILTDPFLTSSAGGIKRTLPPPVSPEEVSPDLVFISHAHYDHLDLKTLKKLNGNFIIVTPENCKKVIRTGHEVIELKDFESTLIKGIKIIKTPALHNKGRNLLHSDTGVGGFIFEVDSLRFYFAGDTTFSCSFYEEILEKTLHIDFAMLPIGGFMPFPFRKFHQTPEEAVKGFKILKANYLIPIHFGTWHLFSFYLKKEKAVERLKTYSYICNLQDKVVIIEPGSSSTFEI